ncbi:MAG TPA: purine-nucleoside phosphorylase, partial [Acidimicrobiales bacterium]
MSDPSVPTPHLEAAAGDFAPSVLLPGDPRRAAYIAERFLSDVRKVNEVRNAWGFTGTYKGVPVSVLGSGMGMPSTGIYATELVRFYGARRLIRVGTCGAIQPEVALGDVVVASAASTDSTFPATVLEGLPLSLPADFDLLEAAVRIGRARGDGRVHVGQLWSADVFYDPRPINERLLATGVLAVEMEAAALYALGIVERFAALTIATVSDHILR